MFVAKLPGSMYATEATKAGPKYVQSSRRPRPGPVSTTGRPTPAPLAMLAAAALAAADNPT